MSRQAFQVLLDARPSLRIECDANLFVPEILEMEALQQQYGERFTRWVPDIVYPDFTIFE